MTEPNEIPGRVTEIVDKYFGLPVEGTIAEQYGYAIDVMRPTPHGTKAEFQLETEQVDRLLGQVDGLLDALKDAFGDDEDRKNAVHNIIAKVDLSARARFRKAPAETIIDLAKNAVIDSGLGFTTMFVLFDLKIELLELKEELALHGETFWSGSSRPPDHYARTIALRLGREVKRRTGALPTYGAARDGGHPSTAYGKALEEIFGVLEIKTKIRHPAQWAIKHLAENPHDYYPGSILSGPPTIYDVAPHKPRNYLSEIVDAMAKRQ